MMFKFKYSFIFLFLLWLLFFNNSFFFAQDINASDDALQVSLEASISEGEEISLEKALDLAVKNNLNIINARANKDLYKWKYIENIGNFLPDVKAGLSSQRFDGTFLVGGVFPIMALTSSANAFARFDYRFFEGGKGFFNTLAAGKLFRSARENISQLVNDTFLSVAKSYYTLLREQAQLEVLSKSVDEAKSVLDLNRKLENTGAGTRFDVLQSEAQLAEEEQSFIDQQVKVREASISLAKLLNIDQGVQLKPDTNDLLPKNLFDITKPINEIISIAMKNRPELKKARLEYFAMKNYTAGSFSAYLPKANFYGQYGGNGRVFFHRTKVSEVVPDAIALDANGSPVVSTVRRNQMFQTADLSDITMVSDVIKGAGKPYLSRVDDSLMVSRFIGIQIDWDFGDGLGVPAFSRIKQAKQSEKLARVNLDNINLKIEEEVRASYLKVQSTNKQLTVSRKRLEAAKEALRLAKLRIENGVGINTELLNAQKQYLSALQANTSAIANFNSSQTELLHAVGVINKDSLVK